MLGWVKGIAGVLCVLLGLGWIGQGTGLIMGSSLMSGQPVWAVIGLVVLLVGGWLLWSLVRARGRIGASRT